MAYGYEVVKEFITTIKGKSVKVKHGDIISYEDAKEMRNLQGLINCRYLAPIEKELPKKEEDKKINGVFK